MHTALVIALEAAAAVWVYTEIRRWLGGYADRVVYGDPDANRRIARAMAAHGWRPRRGGRVS